MITLQNPQVFQFLIIVMIILFGFAFYRGLSQETTDTINSTMVVTDSDVIVSSQHKFALGFFSPNGTNRRYMGIWYCVSPDIVVWVANRDSPLNDSTGSLSISSEGNIVVRNGRNETLWSSNVVVAAFNSLYNRTARLLDTGNLVLQDGGGSTIWESFTHPANVFLPNMRPSHNPRTGANVRFNSWRSVDDPGHGNYTSGIDGVDLFQTYVWERNSTVPRWRSGPWNGLVFTGAARTNKYSVNRPFSLQTDQDGTVSLFWGGFEELIRVTLNTSGFFTSYQWHEELREWKLNWASPRHDCDMFNHCGPFAFCNIKSSPICSCLRGYEPREREEWNRGIWRNGCRRRKAFQCEIERNTSKTSKEDIFLELGYIKVPEFAVRVPALEADCRGICLNNCSCLGYAYDVGIGCMFWSETLIDVEQFPNASGGLSFYLRVAHSELGSGSHHLLAFLFSAISSFIALSLAIYFFISWRKYKRKGKRGIVDWSNNAIGSNTDRVSMEELPFFSFEVLADATNNFDEINKLGKGGFGPVYKGQLGNNEEIAVKRLSAVSEQGLEEFINEVAVISKLQHRNLVRLLGCCVERGEKILVYEYVQNRSLDVFLFDKRQNVLDWRKRFNIVEGIGRGLLYLHRDSRLRIIHRDLKPGNILLDEDWNPKISDFGLAKIFGGKQDHAKTGKVVGTYGYMAPEYVIGGNFSEKSDVFSFGVLVLEIISGRKNTSFFHDELSNSLSLLGHAWKLWNENKAGELIDRRICYPSSQAEIMRCLHIGLLCVQECHAYRPNMSTVLSMLSSEIVDLPLPARPGFTDSWSPFDEGSSQSGNRLNITTVEPR